VEKRAYSTNRSLAASPARPLLSLLTYARTHRGHGHPDGIRVGEWHCRARARWAGGHAASGPQAGRWWVLRRQGARATVGAAAARGEGWDWAEERCNDDGHSGRHHHQVGWGSTGGGRNKKLARAEPRGYARGARRGLSCPSRATAARPTTCPLRRAAWVTAPVSLSLHVRCVEPEQAAGPRDTGRRLAGPGHGVSCPASARVQYSVTPPGRGASPRGRRDTSLT
jgi:hypothetical protein